MKTVVQRSRPGFTLIELLVVLAMTCFLLGFLISLMESFRQASIRTSCANNLRQIGLAFHTHHTEYGFFPSGGHSPDDPPTYSSTGIPLVGEQQQAGWGFQILPFVEGTSAWNGGTGRTSQEKQANAVGTPNKVFFCPVRRGPTVWNVNKQGIDGPHAQTDYAASNLEGTGMVRKDKTVRISQITDGTSTTLMVADKSLKPDDLNHSQPDDDVGYTSGFGSNTIRFTDAKHPPNFDQPKQTADNQCFGSLHPTRFFAVFADGSVHAIKYSINKDIFSNLGNIADGTFPPASDDW